MKGWRIFVALIILIGFSGPHCDATVYHSDGSAASVQALQNAALNGDTITLPAGAFTWSTGVTISKGITLEGAGSGSTTLQRAGGFSGSFFSIQNFSQDLPVRVTGIRFNSSVGQNGDLYSIYVKGPYGGTWGLTQVRIDNCYFYGGMRTLFFQYRVNGVVDHNTFQDCACIALHNGDDDEAWNRAGTPLFGTSDSIFFEDNLIVLDNALTYTDVEADTDFGGKMVWRYNTFDTTAFTGTFGSIIGLHGNQDYWQGHDDWLRGTIMSEFYNNTVSFGNAFRILWFRGGRHIVANNSFYGTLGGALVAFDEEEGINVYPLRSSWPAEDQVNNTFIFGNALNDQPQQDSMIFDWQPGSVTFVRRNRDYWTQPPSPSTITAYPRPGYPSLSNYPLPYNPAVTSWTPYIYPHPLVSPITPTPTPTPTVTATASPTATVSPTATPAPTPRAPRAFRATNVTATSFTAHWGTVIGATGYRLDVATNSSFTNYVPGYKNLNVGNTTSRNVTGLAANTFYYYRLRAYNGNGTSPNSSVITVKTS